MATVGCSCFGGVGKFMSGGDVDAVFGTFDIWTVVETAVDAVLEEEVRAEVSIISFRRFDRFRKIFLESPELRDALMTAGFTIDLRRYGLGAGKLFVKVEWA